MAQARKRKPKPAARKTARVPAPPGLVAKLRDLEQCARPELREEDRALIDRTIGAEVWGAQELKKKRKKPRRPGGRPPEYERERILQIAEAYVREQGMPDTLALLAEKVEDACQDAHVAVPGRSRFLAMLSPVFHRHRGVVR